MYVIGFIGDINMSKCISKEEYMNCMSILMDKKNFPDINDIKSIREAYFNALIKCSDPDYLLEIKSNDKDIKFNQKKKPKKENKEEE